MTKAMVGKSEFLVIERVLGDFSVEPDEIPTGNFLLKLDTNVAELHYSFESKKSPEQLIFECVADRLNLPELIDLILAKSEKKRSWDVNLFVKDRGRFVNVGFSRARLGTSHILRPLFGSNAGVDLLVGIIDSQLAYKSSLSNSIISALRQARDSQHLEMKLIWSWYALEWYIQARAKTDGLPGLLDYPRNGSEKHKTKLKRILRTEVEGFLGTLAAIDGGSANASRLGSDIEELRQRLSQNLFALPILGHFDGLSKHFHEILSNIELLITDAESLDFYKKIRDEWMDFRDDTKNAKRARDKFSHESLKRGTFENIRDVDSLNKIFKFMVSVIALLLAVLTQSPQLYDGESKELGLVKYSSASPNPANRLPLEANTIIRIENSTGAFVSEGSVVKENNGFLFVNVKDPSKLLESQGVKSFIPFHPVIRLANYQIACGNVRLICTNESIQLSIGPEKQSSSAVFKIGRWYLV